MADSKEAVIRLRLHNLLKSTSEQADKLTANAEASSVAIFREELETNWANYIAAFNIHEDTVVGKDEATLTTIGKEFTVIHGAYLSSKLHLGKLALANASAGAMNSTMFESHTHTQDATKTVKMPPIKICKFSGETNQWTEFKATCRSILTEKIPDVQRLQYLKEALTGEPRELVAHILPAEGSYNRAMNLLTTRYENTRAIVNGHLRKLYSLDHDEAENETIGILRNVINSVNGLKAAMTCIDVETDTWDAILIFNTSQCLHPNSLKAWEECLNGKREIPTMKMYLDFLETRITILESTASFRITAPSQQVTSKSHHFVKYDKEKAKIFYTLKADFKCLICKKNHLSSRCDGLNRMSVRERRLAVHQSGVCFNCLQSHVISNCPFMPACKKCEGNHHTLLHDEKQTVMLNQVDDTLDTESLKDEADEKLSVISAAHFMHVLTDSVTILATALVPVMWNGRSIVLHALIDQGSTANLITNRACQILNLPRQRANIPMIGVGNSPVGVVLARTTLRFGSIHDESFQHDINSIVVPTITDTFSIESSSVHKWKHIKDLVLADPQFFEANKIDLLLSAAVYAEILLDGIHRGQIGEPIAQQTKLGWIVFGTAQMTANCKNICNVVNDNQNDDPSTDSSNKLRKCWQIEEVESVKSLTPDEQAVKNVFDNGVILKKHGNFVFNLPFGVKSSFIAKMHTVFYASANTNNGISLKDILYVGPTIQPALFNRLLQWHRFRYAFSGDIEKMYRLIQIKPVYALFQCILLFESETSQIKTYKVTTMTFGTANAPFQTIRAINEIGKQIEPTNPKLSASIICNFYVDDYLGSADSIDEARETHTQITLALAKYVLKLRKWNANHSEILANVNETEIEAAVNFDATFKTLGSIWQPQTHRSLFKSNQAKQLSRWTQRTILSGIAKLFDPLTLFPPRIDQTKMLMLKHWLESCPSKWNQGFQIMN